MNDSAPATRPQPCMPRFGRAQRVAALLCVVILLSLGDLYMTLTHLKGPGMIESNPLARVVIGYNSTGAIISWKCATVLLAVLILFVYRRRPSAEAGAWLCAAVMAALTAHWARYNDEVGNMDPDFAAQAAVADPRWVAITDEP